MVRHPCQKHELNVCNEFIEVDTRRTVHLQMPAKPSDNKLYAQIIIGLGVQPPVNRRGTDMELLGLRLLHRQPPKLMIIDEVHHLLAGSVRELGKLIEQGPRACCQDFCAPQNPLTHENVWA